MTLTFHDVSHYQGDYIPTGPTIAKATEGTAFVDSQYATTRRRTLAGNWPFAGYHFLSTEDATAQARHAHSIIASTPAMLDVETGASGNPSFSRTLAFIDAYRKLGGVLYLIYLPKWYWSSEWGSPSLKPLVDRGMQLISSEYTTYSDDGPGWDPYGGMTPAIWQYTSTPLDTDKFKGTEVELGNLFETGEVLALTDADKQWITNMVRQQIADVARQVWNFDPNNSTGLATPPTQPDSPAHNPPGNNVTASTQWFIRAIYKMVNEGVYDSGPVQL